MNSDLQNKLKTIQQDKSKDNIELEDNEIDDMIQYAIRQPYNDSSTYYSPNQLETILPDCYKNINFERETLESYVDETLFYIFYTFCKNKLQISAYEELVKRGYVYSKCLNAFVACEGKMSLDNKKHSVRVFDPFKWTKMTKEVLFDDKFIGTLEK